ncbi:MAG TPA: hypothetical protein VM639_03275 [Dongiaceae bacterium]|nr:hypothetical protein [Dongiaceae bacterium]
METESLDLARLTPQQIAAELARRSQGLRGATGASEGRAEIPADAGSDDRPRADREASPFDRLTQALSPRPAPAPTVEERAAEERAAERRRMKEQYVLERYRREQEHDLSEAARRAAENAAAGRADPAGDIDHPDRSVAGERRIAEYVHHAMPASAPSFPVAPSSSVAPSPAIVSEAVAEQAVPAAMPPAAPPGEPSAERLSSPEAVRREPGLAETRWGELRAPEDIRNLVTTSFDRPVQSVAGGRRHGVLILAGALVIGLALYFHPWSDRQEGQLGSDLPTTNAGSGQQKAADTSPITTPAPPKPVSQPAADLPKPAAPTPQTAPSPSSSAPSGVASAPAPAVEMTPLSAQPAPSLVSPLPVPAPGAVPASASVSKQAPGAAPAVAPGATPGETLKQATGGAETLTTAPGQAQPPQIKPEAKPTAQPVERDAAYPMPKAKDAARSLQPSIKPSPAWLHAQPYDPDGSSVAAPADSTPDAWMKPRPYNPGVLTPPGN